MKKLSTTLIAILVLVASISAVHASDRAAINEEVKFALDKLYKNSPTVKKLTKEAKGVLVFPDVIRGGFIIGGQYGEGALIQNGLITEYYNIVTASYGLQAGAQSFGYVMVLMTDNAVSYLKKSKGWEVGVGPSVVLVDKGVARSLTTTTAKEDVYVFTFDQIGAMAGLGIQGSKISPIDPE